ncbi:MAG: aldehyde dehydrogenase [Anaerolineae bacterium]|nr:aldehyde dehydrogenase [Anaerolineae bacterium]
MPVATLEDKSPLFSEITTTVAISPSAQKRLDAAVETLCSHKDEWAATDIPERISLIDILIKQAAAVAGSWVRLSCEAKGIDINRPAAIEEWLGGPYLVLHNLRLIRQSLLDINRYGRPRIPGPVTVRPNGQVVAQVFPQNIYDCIFYAGITAEVWMEPGVTLATLPQTQATAYQNKNPKGKVALVLGAGNYSCLGPADFSYKLFVENQVVVYKTNPINAYLDPLIEKAFGALIERGFLRLVGGGVAEGVYLSHHPGIDEIHLTGSDKTFEAIVFGSGAAGAKRKAERTPLLTKRVTGELGNVSPVIIVPGPWRERDLNYHARQLASMLVVNASFNCLTARVILNHAGWPQRTQLLDKTRDQLAQIPLRRAYYTGAAERYQTFLSAHPEAEKYGGAVDGKLPWTLIAGLDPNKPDDICFTTEAFCSIFAEILLDAPSVPEYIDRAVEFANNHLWGTLNATLIVHPASLQDPATAAAVERAIENLRYGTVAINQWAVVGYGLVVPNWGGFPGHDIYDIQSGIGVVHNTLMFSRPQKSVIRAPFTIKPTPIWFVTHKTGHELGPKLVNFETLPSPWKLPGIFWSALRG